MKNIIAFSVKHPVSVLMIVLTFILLGVLCFFTVSVDFLPVISNRKILIATEYEGIAAKDIRTMVTVPLEDAFASLKGLKTVSSISRDGLSLVTLELHWGTDADMALIECREIIDVCFETLPSRCRKPIVQQSVSGERNTVTIAVIPRDNDLQYGRYITDTDIKPRLQRLNGAGLVTVSGGEKEQIQVRVFRDKMESKKISLQTVNDVLSGANFEYPAGTIREGEKELLVKTSGLYTSADEIGKTPLAYNEGGLLRISDIAEVVRTVKRKQTFFLYDGLECIRVGVTKKSGASPLSVSRLVKNELDILEQVYGQYYTFRIIDDLSEQIKESLVSLLISAAAGIAVTAAVILFFLKSWKYALLLSSVIPISALVSVFALAVSGKTINIMSLSGMAIGIGMVVDCSAVVLENLQKSMPSADRTAYKEVIIAGTDSVALSNIGSALTTIVVFIPVFFMNGLLGELFADMALSIIVSILTSCVLSITYIPAVFTLIAPHIKNFFIRSKRLEKVETQYAGTLERVFARKYIPFVLIGICVLVGTVSFFFIDYELLPAVSSNTITAEIIFPNGTSTEFLQQNALIIHERLKQEDYITSVSISGGIEPDSYQDLSVPAACKEKLSIVLGLRITPKAAEKHLAPLFANTRYAVSFSENGDMLSDLLSIQDDRYIVCAGKPEEAVRSAALYVADMSQVIPNVPVTEFVFVPDRISGARFSVSALYTASLARDSLEGIKTMPYYEGGREIEVLVKLQDTDIQSLSDLESIGVQLEKAFVPLRTLGSIQQETNEKVLYRYNRKDAKILIAPIVPQNNALPQDSLISLQKLELDELMGESAVLMVVVLLLLYLVMGAQFESFLIPLLLMFALPPAFSGAFLFLAAFGKTLNINSIIALVVLFGTSVNNAILLYENCISVPIITQKTIIASCREKLRAIFITNLTTICALLPFAVDPFNRHAQSSLSLAIIGGLLFSMLLVLFVIPVLFSVTLPKRRKKNE